jgi:hypothetical protein
LHISYIYPTSDTDQHHVQIRCQNLVDAIQRGGQHRASRLDINSFVQRTDEAVEICQSADALVIYKYLYGSILRQIEYWKARDKKVLVDFDEAIDLLPPETLAYRFWNFGEALPGISLNPKEARKSVTFSPLEQFRCGLRLVDAASVPSYRLADDWSRVVKIVHIPDFININQYPSFPPNVDNGEIRIGIFTDSIGTAGLQTSGLLEAVEEIVKLRPKVKFIFYNADAAMVGNLDTLPWQKINYLKIPFENWPGALAQVNIGLLPVNDPYGQRSSLLTLLELMAMKIPWIATDCPTFREVNRLGWLVVNSYPYWLRSIIEVIDHFEAYRSNCAGEPFLYALRQDVNENISKILATYASLF